jgi:hypothetical protein
VRGCCGPLPALFASEALTRQFVAPAAFGGLKSEGPAEWGTQLTAWLTVVSAALDTATPARSRPESATGCEVAPAYRRVRRSLIQ